MASESEIMEDMGVIYKNSVKPRRFENSWKNAFILMAIIVGSMMAVILTFRASGLMIGITQSASVNNFMFILSSDGRDSVSVGQYVSFEYPQTTNLKGRVIKRVEGVAGDKILSVEGRIFINGELKFKAKAQTLKGRKIISIPSQVIPEGYVFVAGDIKDSYDSRYEEFGLVPVDSIEFIGRALW